MITFLPFPCLFTKKMNKEIIKEFSDITRTQIEFIEHLWQNQYEVVSQEEDLSSLDEDDKHIYICSYSVKKRSNPKEKRDIYYPYSEKLKTIFKITSKWLQQIYTAPNCVNGFLRKKGIKTNAEPHLQCSILIKLDLKNFYEQISTSRISDSIMELGIKEELANLVAKICTIDGKLVQGFSTSPVISNIVTKNLDIVLEDYCKSNKITYTRYADDMSFSSTTNQIEIDGIVKLIEDYGFEINSEKTKILKRGYYQSVTGLTIFDNIMPRIPKRMKRKLRLETYYINKFGMKNHAIRNLVRKGKYNNNSDRELSLATEIDMLRERIEGWINFSRAIEPDFSLKIQQLYEGRKDSP